MDDVTLLSWIERGQNIAALLVALGVAGEFALGYMAGPARKRIDAARDSEIVQLTNESAKAGERAAQIEQDNIKLRNDLNRSSSDLATKQTELATEQRKTAEAQLALEKLVQEKTQPRGVPPDEVFLKPFKVSPSLKPLRLVILYQKGQQETGMFADNLWINLSRTNWVPERPKGVDNLLDIPGATVPTEIIVVTNGHEQRWSDITRSEIALLQALNTLNRPMHQTYDEDLPDGTVEILIAPRL